MKAVSLDRITQLMRNPAWSAFGGGSVAVIFSTITATFGLAAVPRLWLVLGTLILTAAAAGVGFALTPSVTDRQRVYGLTVTTCSLVLFIVGAAAYNQWFEFVEEEYALVEFVVATDNEARGVPLSGEPGGPGLRLAKDNRPLEQLWGGQSYAFSCRVTLNDGTSWLRLADDDSYWVPEAAMRPRAGASADELSSCD